MASDLGLYLNSINKTKENVMRGDDVDPKVISGFPTYMIRKLLSYSADAVLYVNEVNSIPHLDPQMQYEYLLHALSKKNRFNKLHKVTKLENTAFIKKYYRYSDAKASAVVDLHTDEEIANIKAQLSEGGIVREE